MFDDGLRRDGRSHDAMRPVCFEVGVNRHSEGSCRVSFGLTQLLICATVEHRVPSFLRGQGRGWLSSEYAMMVRATPDRNDRRRQLDDGRSREIARLIGRSLRSIVDFAALGERQIKIDCDVIDADAGTRTAAISGGYVALAQACRKLVDDGVITGWPLQDSVSAVSVVLHRGRALVDPDYREDSRADVDTNFVINGSGGLVEVQASSEGAAFSSAEFQTMLALAEGATASLCAQQRSALAEHGIRV